MHSTLPSAQGGISLNDRAASWEGCERKWSVGTNYSSIWRAADSRVMEGLRRAADISCSMDVKQVPEVCS